MKSLFPLSVASGLAVMTVASVSTSHASAAFVVHEWGTFTSVSGSDGGLLPGLEVEEERLPNFVHCFDGFAPFNKGFDRPVRNVTIKMETPVIYFYADHEMPVEVNVRFHGGSISQWYPERSGGEELRFCLRQTRRGAREGMQCGPIPSIDFGIGHEGSIQWKATVLAPDTTEKINNPQSWETPQWSRARVAGANLVKGPSGWIETSPAGFSQTAPVVEGFLFYRGVGNFPLPVRITAADDGTITVKNTGGAVIPYLLVYQNKTGRAPKARELFDLAPGEKRTVPSLGVFKLSFRAALEKAGLTSGEAAAMLATWKESYFDRPGLRVFWIVPRAFTDRILPLSITPEPVKLERVLVGRTEVLTPAFEADLKREFSANGGVIWTRDRYFKAYRERVRQLGVVLPGETP